ncbi:MAG: hypothetical protein K6G76_03190 [Lachnospiraceae bacterium]|nr:hypothetical protein [Lachnospiraceae bacterium]
MDYLNDEVIKGFSEDEKKRLFDDIMDMYFHRNFGTISKTDFETYIFSYYIEHLLDNDLPYDDYTLGKDLGITQSKVRSLKERKELRYPRKEYNWKKSFLEYAQNAKYDEVKHLVKFIIPDVNVIKDARNFFEINNQYDEYQLNPKLFQCRADAFLEIGRMLAEEEHVTFDNSINKNQLKKILDDPDISEQDKKLASEFFKEASLDGLKEILINCSKEVILMVLESLFPQAGHLKTILNIIQNALNR